jgi:hypothetical protein
MAPRGPRHGRKRTLVALARSTRSAAESNVAAARCEGISMFGQSVSVSRAAEALRH